MVKVGKHLANEVRAKRISFLKNNLDYFAWSHEDMTGIPKDVINHKLNVDPSFRRIKQKRRKFAPERNKIINEEV